MPPKLSCLLILSIGIMGELHAGLGFAVAEKNEATDNLIVTLSESPSQRKCKEYSKKQDLCMAFNRTIDASQGEMPHIVMVSSAFLPFRVGRMDRICGGALISENFVLTSGTCAYIVQMITDEGEAFVRLGEVQQNFENDEELDNMTQLEKSVQFNDFIRPACLQTGGHLGDDSALIVSDWNRGEDDTHTLRVSSAFVVPYNRNETEEIPQNYDTTGTMLCVNRAGGIPSEDDGATIFQVLSIRDCYFHVIGISGLTRCGTAKEPHKLLYTRLAPNMPWIEKNVWPQETSIKQHPIT